MRTQIMFGEEKVSSHRMLRVSNPVTTQKFVCGICSEHDGQPQSLLRKSVFRTVRKH